MANSCIGRGAASDGSEDSKIPARVNTSSLARTMITFAVAALVGGACGSPIPSASALLNSAPTPSPTFGDEESVTPSATASQVEATTCDASQLQISMVASSAGLGSEGGYLSFVNIGATRCQLRGWPTVVGRTGAGTTTVARQVRSGLLSLPGVAELPIVTLDPGTAAIAAFAGSDIPGPGSRSCPPPPPYSTLDVTPPGGAASTSISAWIPYAGAFLPSCEGIEVTPVVPAAELPPS